MAGYIHHVEMCVANGKKVLSYLVDKFGFSMKAWRETQFCYQWVVDCKKSTFLVTQRKLGVLLQSLYEKRHKPFVNIRNDGTCNTGQDCHSFNKSHEPWTVFCCEDKECHTVDSVFNVALQVKDVDRLTQKVEQNGGRIIQSPLEIKDDCGSVNYSIVGSCCGNIVHTLLDKQNYKGVFLPGFYNVNNTDSRRNIMGNGDQLKELTTHMDHVTFVVRKGETDKVIEWYAKCFGMKRFLVNRQEDEKEGVITDNVGLRLKVMDYWKCAEKGLSSPRALKDDSVLRVVLAESLWTEGNSHTETFLREHNGPGVQHIGLHTSSIVDTVEEIARRGVQFRKPPFTYYSMAGKLSDIEKSGEDPERFQKQGILLDTEADMFLDMEEGKQASDKYLMQIFTLPLFEQETFFLEVIQRKGAQGFGAGNISALAHSIEEFMKKQKEEEEKKQETNKHC